METEQAQNVYAEVGDAIYCPDCEDLPCCPDCGSTAFFDGECVYCETEVG